MTWYVSRLGPSGIPVDEVCADQEAAMSRQAELRGVRETALAVAWFCTDSVGPWGGGKRDESHKNGPVAAEQAPEVSLAVPEPLRATGFEMQDWQRRAFQAVRDEGISA